MNPTPQEVDFQRNLAKERLAKMAAKRAAQAAAAATGIGAPAAFIVGRIAERLVGFLAKDQFRTIALAMLAVVISPVVFVFGVLFAPLLLIGFLVLGLMIFATSK